MGRSGAGLATGPEDENGPTAAEAFLLSAALPGAGQFAQGQRRWTVYLAAEGVLWFFWADFRSDARRFRNRYRELAWTAARRPLVTGPRRDGDFEYYETLSQWTRSGVWDREPERPGLQPETDLDTFNGSVWALARSLFLPGGGEGVDEDDPAYRLALDFYRAEAADPDFLWDWSGREDDLERFRDLIDSSDDRFRKATFMIGALIGNHILSAADAFVSRRLRDATHGRLDISVDVRMPGLPPLAGARGGDPTHGFSGGEAFSPAEPTAFFGRVADTPRVGLTLRVLHR